MLLERGKMPENKNELELEQFHAKTKKNAERALPPTLKVVGAEAEYLMDLPVEHRSDALANFRALCNEVKFNTVFEKSKAMKFFYIGYAAALARVGGECGPPEGKQ